MLDKLRSFFETDAEHLPEHEERIKKLESIIEFSVNDPGIFLQALRHRSTVEDDHFSSSDSYERLEFLGDAVLDLIVTEVIFDLYPEKDEGFLTKLRAKLVRGDSLAMFARKLELQNFILLGKRVKGQGVARSKSVLADAFEALVGAIYVDLGYDNCLTFVRNVIHKHVDFDKLLSSLDNYKSLLLEYAQARQLAIPTYHVIAERGPDHNKTFEVEVRVDKEAMAEGEGKSKKEAEQRAACKALNKLKEKH